MARKKKTKKKIAVENYTHESARRRNIPTAKMAGEGKIPKVSWLEEKKAKKKIKITSTTKETTLVKPVL